MQMLGISRTTNFLSAQLAPRKVRKHVSRIKLKIPKTKTIPFGAMLWWICSDEIIYLKIKLDFRNGSTQ